MRQRPGVRSALRSGAGRFGGASEVACWREPPSPIGPRPPRFEAVSFGQRTQCERMNRRPKRLVVATTGGAVSSSSSGLGGIARTAVSVFRRLNYSKDRYLRKSVGKIRSPMLYPIELRARARHSTPCAPCVNFKARWGGTGVFLQFSHRAGSII